MARVMVKCHECGATVQLQGCEIRDDEIIDTADGSFIDPNEVTCDPCWYAEQVLLTSDWVSM